MAKKKKSNKKDKVEETIEAFRKMKQLEGDGQGEELGPEQLLLMFDENRQAALQKAEAKQEDEVQPVSSPDPKASEKLDM